MKAYICLNCAFSTIIENRFEKCPICNNKFTQLTNKESKVFLNLNGDQRIQWVENKIGHSIPYELNELRENYKNKKWQEIEQQKKDEQSIKLSDALEHGKAVLDEQYRQPKCPTCQSTNLKNITVTSKVVNTAMFGIFGTKRHKTFHCNNCGYEW